MQHVVFFIIAMLFASVVYVLDRKHIKNYILLCAFTLVLAYIVETTTTYLGLWSYHSLPKIPLISLYTWLLYIPYISFCYFIGNRLCDRND